MEYNLREGDLPVFVEWMDFVHWLLNTTSKFPKKVRFTLTTRIDNFALDVVENLVEARYTKNKLPFLKAINIQLEKLRILLRICHQERYLSTHAYELASKKINTVGQMIGNWSKQQEKT